MAANKIQIVKTGWHPSGETCPKCKQETENHHEKIEGHWCITGERCKRCRWRIDF
jgi:hypothetical protein